MKYYMLYPIFSVSLLPWPSYSYIILYVGLMFGPSVDSGVEVYGYLGCRDLSQKAPYDAIKAPDCVMLYALCKFELLMWRADMKKRNRPIVAITN